MPFLTYQISAEQAMRNAASLFQEGSAAAVKVEGGRPVIVRHFCTEIREAVCTTRGTDL
jgi:ketopantoate hydroxymethyltransferase